MIRTFIALCLSFAAAANADVIVYHGATVHTMGPDGTIENATIVIRDGVFESVSADSRGPSDAQRIDISERIVTPGLFSAMGRLGLTEVSLVEETVDYQQNGQQFTAAFEVADVYNQRSSWIAINRSGGLTRALTAPGPAFSFGDATVAPDVFSGRAAVVQLGEEPEYVTTRHGAMVVSLGETGAGLSGGSRAAALLALQAALDEALDYRRPRGDWERGQRYEYRRSQQDLEALQPVLSGDLPLLVTVHRANDIAALLDIVRRYRIRAIVYGGAEAWLLADELAAAGVAVILDSKLNLPMRFETLNARFESPAILADAGVEISFAGNQAETFAARNITQSAGVAVANGLSWRDALHAITLAPAKIYGLDDRLGSIEAGKEADLVVWSADPLELTSNPERVVIRGREVSLENRQTLLRDRYWPGHQEPRPAWRR